MAAVIRVLSNKMSLVPARLCERCFSPNSLDFSLPLPSPSEMGDLDNSVRVRIGENLTRGERLERFGVFFGVCV